MKLTSMLSELLDYDPESSESYELSVPKVSKHQFTDGDTEVDYTWEFKNAKKRKMDITILLRKDVNGDKPTMSISFGKATGSSIDRRYGSTTGAGDLNKILATVIKAAHQVIDQNIPNGVDGLYAIRYSASDDRRDRIYKYFIKKYFSNFELHKSGFLNTIYVNQNYQPPQ